jgi:hypothetical protein
MTQDFLIIGSSLVLGLALVFWLSRRHRRATQFPARIAYVVPFRLYSEDGSRGVEVRVRRDGQSYFVEQERVEGTTYKNRGRGEEIGPFATPEAAEAAAVARPWFSGEESDRDTTAHSSP